MEGTKYFTAVIWMALCVISAYSQSSYQERIYQAFIRGDMAQWHAVMMDYAESEPTTVQHKIELLDYYYGYTAWLVGNEKKAAKDYIKSANKLMDSILRKDPRHATTLAYKGAFIGFEIGLHPMKAPFLGPKSIAFIEQALDIDPFNIQALIEHANALYYRPAIFGGDKKLAIDFYIQAVSLMEKNNLTQQNWAYLNLLTVLAQAYDETDALQKAKQTYEKILEHEADYSWVRDELYPTFLQKHEREYLLPPNEKKTKS